MALNEIAEILLAAGCGESETEMIVSSIQKGDSQKNRKADRKVPQEAARQASRVAGLHRQT